MPDQLNYRHTRQDIQSARNLRKASPKPEYLLWNALRQLHKENDVHFRRQHPVHPYIADFASVKAKLIIEIDGMSHDIRIAYDAHREEFLRSKGWTIIRFTNDQVLQDCASVVLTIMEKVREIMAAKL